jgi:hypothetical protein
MYEDRAAALGRIGGTLQSLLDALATIRAQFGGMPAARRAEARARYQELRDKASTYRWYLEVQREAVGLTRHDLVDELYPLPPAELL